MSHTINKYYLIGFEQLFNDLASEQFFVDVDTFVQMFALAGNEKINSLLEYDVKEARETLEAKSREEFIRDKYALRRFINSNEIDYSSNYVDELNRLLFGSVAAGRSLIMTIYYVFLGANVNARIAGRFVVENSRDFQTIYLFFQVQFRHNKPIHLYTAGSYH